MIAVIFITLSVVYLSLNFTQLYLRNKKAHQFFKTRAPKLTVLPNPKPYSGHLFQVTHPDKNWKILTDLHDKLGSTFGYYMCDQPWVSTKDLDILKFIEVEEAHKHINRSKFGLPFKEFNHSIFQVDDDDWRKVRRAIAPALTNHKVRSEEVVSDLKEIIDQLDGSLRRKIERSRRVFKQNSVVLDIHDTFQRYTLAAIFLLTYKRCNEIDFDGEKDRWVELMDYGARNISNWIVSIAMMFPFLRPLCTFLVQFSDVGKLQVKVVEYIVAATDINRIAREKHQVFQRRLSMTTGAKERRFEDLRRQGDFQRRMVDTIIDAYLERKIDYDHFIGSTLFLLLAGFETTADTITCLVWHLAHNSDIQEKLRKTIVEEGIDADYVMWCINETIRWHPAVPLGTGRILGDDINVNGTFLPKGTFVMPSTFSIHHDDKIWPEADKFKPERWKNSSTFHPAAFMGFGLGPRNCVGGKLAIHEVKLLLQMLLRDYRIEKCAETINEYDFSSPGLVFTIPDRQIKVKLVALYPDQPNASKKADMGTETPVNQNVHSKA